jgi:heat shock protein HtpX
MIMALRKIENRGELHAATSAVMEMCVDNPREGFSDIFATHPSIESRVEAIVKFAGGHDPGPLALEPPDEQLHLEDQSAAAEGYGGPSGDAPRQPAPKPGPWGPAPGTPPLLPPGPWGPRQS